MILIVKRARVKFLWQFLKNRGEKIVNESRRKAEQLKETPRMYNESRVTAIEPVKGNADMINLRIQEEDYNIDEGTMRLVQENENQMENGIGYEEENPEDYILE